VDAATAATIRCRFELREGGRTRSDTIEVDAAARAWRSRSEKDDGSATERAGRLDGPAHDPVAVFYALRARPIPLEGEVALVELGRYGPRRVGLLAEREETVAIPGLGRFRAVRLAAPDDAPGFLARGEAALWLDAATGVLLRMEVTAEAGTFSMTLVEAKGSALREAK
jgi:hypothetical protein